MTHAKKGNLQHNTDNISSKQLVLTLYHNKDYGALQTNLSKLNMLDKKNTGENGNFHILIKI